MSDPRDDEIYLDALDAPEEPTRDGLDPEALGALADDMGANGLLQRIGARGPSSVGRYEVIWGHRRSEAARMLRWETIPARVFPWATSPTVARLAENMVRAELNPREEARACVALVRDGRTHAEVARIMRRSISWVATRLDLSTWSEGLQAAVATGRLGLGVARLLAEVDHEGYRMALVDEAIRCGATERTAMVWLAHYTAERGRIINNHETVEQMIQHREVYIVRAACESCGAEVAMTETALLRVCRGCVDDLRTAQAEVRAEPAGGVTAAGAGC